MTRQEAIDVLTQTGSVTKVMIDALMALWGAPQSKVLNDMFDNTYPYLTRDYTINELNPPDLWPNSTPDYAAGVLKEMLFDEISKTISDIE